MQRVCYQDIHDIASLLHERQSALDASNFKGTLKNDDDINSYLESKAVRNHNRDNILQIFLPPKNQGKKEA